MTVAPSPVMEKPRVRVDVSSGAATVLGAQSLLSHLKPGASLNEKLDRRHPLGIYNVSVSRICSKLRKCCERAEAYWKAGHDIASLQGYKDLREEFLDYFELSIYAAAEHVDDVEAIASSFFADQGQFAKSPEARVFKKQLKESRDRISAIANAIKHNQSRLRLFSQEFVHDQRPMCLHGFFVEGYSNGVIGPSPIIHGSGERVVSVTAFMWTIVVFLASVSRALTALLHSISAVPQTDTPPVIDSQFALAIVSVARLPLYSFDDRHPFLSTTLVIDADEDARSRLDSGLYGSIVHRWTQSKLHEFRRNMLQYEGDGASRSFQTMVPTQVALQHW
jgi:hypothetical protein